MKWFNSLSVVLVISLTLTACGGGGGDGGTGGPPPTTAQTTVSGTVQAPNGQVAFHQPTLWDVFESSAFASLSGLTPVPDGTPVQLGRMSSAGAFTVLASTTVSGGRYSFNLTSLGLSLSNNLVVQVINQGAGAQMRAFVVWSTVNLDPISEASVRLVLDQILLIPGATLSQFTVPELRDIAGAVNQLATVKQATAGLNIETTVTSIKNLVAAEPGVNSFIAAAAGVGQTTEGPGDIGNYFPLDKSNMWKFQGTYSKTGQSTVNFSNTMTVKGTKLVGTVTTTILAESNPLNTGIEEEDYNLKDSQGILNYGNNDPSDTLSPNLVPYREVVFPLNLDVTSEVVNKKGVNFGQDLDLPRDGKNETADVLSQVTVEKFEDVTVPKGTFTNTAKVVHKTTITVFSSAGFGSATVVSTETVWFAPNLGPVKRTIVLQGDGGQITETSTEELVDVFLALATNDIIYDPTTKKIYASIPGNPGSIRSIDPATGDIGPPIQVGNEPLKLAISNNGQYLYVGLDGEGAVQRVDLTTQTAGLKFSLGSDPTFGTYYVQDIEVLPGSPQSVAVSRMYKGVSPQHAGVAIYDNGVQRPIATPGFIGSNVIEFSTSANTLYGYGTETVPSMFYRMAVTQTGASITDATQNLLNDLSDITFEGGLIYSARGSVIDPQTLTALTSFAGLQLPVSVRPDSSVGRVFFLEESSSQIGSTIKFTARIKAYDMATRQLLAIVEFPDVSDMTNSLIRWGSKGLAFRSGGSQGAVVVVESPNLIP